MRRAITAVAAGALLLVALAAPALAQTQPAYGTVDITRVEKEFKGMQQIKAEFEDYTRAQQAKLADREKVMMLSDADATKYTDLQQAAPTDANKKAIADLEASARTREQRLQELMGKKERTAAEQTEYDDLNKVYLARMTDLSKLKDDLDKQVQAKGDDLMKKANDQVEAAVKAVAEQKKLTTVFLKAAVLYGGTDITDDVLTKLNAAPAAPAK